MIGVKAFPARKFAGAAGVILLHAGAIAALLSAFHRSVPPIAPSPEHIVWFTLPPKPQPIKKTETPEKKPVRAISNAPTYFDYRTVNIPPMTGETNLNGLHGFLFNCAPENLANLTAEQRADCAIASRKPDDTVDYADHTDRSKHAVRWARGLMRKQQPLLLPCSPPLSLAALICVGKGISDGGFDLDAMPNYGDKPQEVHVPNNGDEPNGPPG